MRTPGIHPFDIRLKNRAVRFCYVCCQKRAFRRQCEENALEKNNAFGLIFLFPFKFT